MPPKEKISKAKVMDTAFEMTKEYGFKEVTARKLADRLGCSTQPIFRAYENMEELREDMFYMSTDYFCETILKKRTRAKSAYQTVALSYINLAKTERNLFELIASIDDFGTQTIDEFLKKDEWQPLLDSLPGLENASQDKKIEVFTMLWMFVHGMAVLIVSGRIELSDKRIKELIEKAYEGFSGK